MYTKHQRSHNCVIAFCELFSKPHQIYNFILSIAIGNIVLGEEIQNSHF